MTALFKIPARPSSVAFALSASAAAAGENRPPLVWALFSSRAGDNAQVRATAEALGLPYEVKHFSNRPLAIPLNLAFGARYPWSVKSVAPALQAPWPDLVIAAGTQSEPICQLIQARAAEAGHRVKIVFLGRPWRDPAAYDLIVTTPQYRVPLQPNVLELQLPLHQVSVDAAARAALPWRDRISHLPKPHIMVALGGSINRYTLDAEAARRLALRLNALAQETGGSILVSSSYRTPAGIMPALARHLTAPAYLHDGGAAAGDNPYLAFLGLADCCIVTGDSMSMLAEACEMRKPVFIFDLGVGRFRMQPGTPGTERTGPRDSLWLRSLIRAWLKDRKVRLIEKILPRRLKRDTDPIRAYLVASGQAAWLGEAFLADQATTRITPGSQRIEMVAARVRALIAHLPALPNQAARPAVVALKPRGIGHAV